MSSTVAERMVEGWNRLPPRIRDAVLRAANATSAALYSRTGGRVGGRIKEVPVLLLTTTGRRSGKPRTNPLFFLDDGARTVVVASYGGDDRGPAWFRNLTAEPEVTVQVGRRITRMRARVADPGEKARLWPRLVDMYQQYDLYQRLTTRDIPVVILTPV